MQIQKVTDAAFSKYGKVIEGLDCADIIEAMGATPCPAGVTYVPGDASLEACASAEDIAYSLYGGMPIQIGYCNGNNHKLNGLEYHRDSEINIAVTDLILLIGAEQDIVGGKYDTAKVEAFLVPQGTVIEVYATTLHYAPCNANEGGFKCCRRARTRRSKSAPPKPRRTRCSLRATSGCSCIRRPPPRASTWALSARTSRSHKITHQADVPRDCRAVRPFCFL